MGGREFLFQNPADSSTGIEITGTLRDKTGPETTFDQDRSRVRMGWIHPSLYWIGINSGPSCHIGVEDERYGSRILLTEIDQESSDNESSDN